jgi:DNA helicase-2/ATP-dependent DNA helicase PcrA
MHRTGFSARPWEDEWVPSELASAELPVPGAELAARRRAELAYVSLTRARLGAVLCWPAAGAEGAAQPSREYEVVRDALGATEEVHEEELFGPAEGLHATYRMIRDEVLEASWRAGSALSEMRLDTAQDVNSAVARFLELLKLAALIQRPGEESTAEALAGLNELLSRIATAEQRAELERSSLDDYVAGEEQERGARLDLVGAATEPGLQRFIPHRGDGLALSASDIDLYRTCPLKYKFARVFAIPQEPTINQRFGILIHQVLDRFHSEEMRGTSGNEFSPDAPGSIERLLALFEGGWRRTGFGASDDELQYRDRAVAALARYHEHHTRSEARPVWLERTFSFAIGPHQLRGRVDRVDRLPDGGYQLIDYKTGGAKDANDLVDDLQIPLYRLGARAAWEVDPEGGAYWYVLDDERVQVPSAPDDAERVERTVLEVAAGIEAQDFEPRPSYEICSWCDYRLICPASEA